MTATAIDRFLAKVSPSLPETCWLWEGGIRGGGYGGFWTGSGQTAAHRFAYEAMVGPIPEGLVLDHLCRNRICVNPAHLEPVTQRENVLRGYAKFKSQRTHCARGHELTGDNVIVERRGDVEVRKCRVCWRDRRQARFRRDNPDMFPLETHCRNGHPRTPENTYVQATGARAGKRQCRICRRICLRAKT